MKQQQKSKTNKQNKNNQPNPTNHHQKQPQLQKQALPGLHFSFPNVVI